MTTTGREVEVSANDLPLSNEAWLLRSSGSTYRLPVCQWCDDKENSKSNSLLPNASSFTNVIKGLSPEDKFEIARVNGVYFGRGLERRRAFIVIFIVILLLGILSAQWTDGRDEWNKTGISKKTLRPHYYQGPRDDGRSVEMRWKVSFLPHFFDVDSIPRNTHTQFVHTTKGRGRCLEWSFPSLATHRFYYLHQGKKFLRSSSPGPSSSLAFIHVAREVCVSSPSRWGILPGQLASWNPLCQRRRRDLLQIVTSAFPPQYTSVPDDPAFLGRRRNTQ